jgi:hypothetical protein
LFQLVTPLKITELVKAGVKEDFAIEVVEKSGNNPDEIINNPARVLEEYWYANSEEAIDFLDNAVAVNGVFFVFFYFPLSSRRLKDFYNSRGAQTGSHSPAVSGCCYRQSLRTRPSS